MTLIYGSEESRFSRLAIIWPSAIITFIELLI